jgi:acyl-phosphate glycerol 3-phosphate acyltransferase
MLTLDEARNATMLPAELDALWQPTRDRRLISGKRAMLDLAICAFAYLYGSLPFVYLLARVRHVDLRGRGSGNVGATNLWAIAGNWPALLGWIGDASKGIIPAAAARGLGCSRETAQMAGVCGVAGQCWPVFLGLRGGRGISAFVGAALWINPRAWSAALLPMIGGSTWRMLTTLGPRRHRVARTLKTTRSRSVPLGCLLGAAAFPAASYAVDRRMQRPMALAPWLLLLVIVLRRLTARLPDDATHGPQMRPEALLYRLLFDRNTLH